MLQRSREELDGAVEGRAVEVDAEQTAARSLGVGQHDAHGRDRAPVGQHLRVRADDARVLRVVGQLLEQRRVAHLALGDRVPERDDAIAADVVDRDLGERVEQRDDRLAAWPGAAASQLG